MAIVVDVTNLGATDVGNTSTPAFTTTSIVASNGFIVLQLGWFGTITLSSVSGGGLTWTIDKQGNPADPNQVHVAIISAQAPSGLASSTTITATLSGAGAACVFGGISFTGVKTTSPVDGTPLGATGVATAAWSSGSYAIAAGSVIVATCFNENTATGNTPTSPSIEIFDVANGPNVYGCTAEYRIESSAGSYAVAGTWGSAQKNANVAVAYLAAATGTVNTECMAYLPPRRGSHIVNITY